MNRLQGAILAVALLFALVACTTTLPGTPLAIETVGFQVGGGCAGVGLLPFRIERDGDSLRFVDVETAAPLRLVFPSGFAARLVDGTAVLYAATGAVVAREGEVIKDAGACPRSDGSILVDSFTAPRST
jgi:hypothetical protein